MRSPKRERRFGCRPETQARFQKAGKRIRSTKIQVRESSLSGQRGATRRFAVLLDASSRSAMQRSVALTERPAVFDITRNICASGAGHFTFYFVCRAFSRRSCRAHGASHRSALTGNDDVGLTDASPESLGRSRTRKTVSNKQVKWIKSTKRMWGNRICRRRQDRHSLCCWICSRAYGHPAGLAEHHEPCCTRKSGQKR